MILFGGSSGQNVKLSFKRRISIVGENKKGRSKAVKLIVRIGKGKRGERENENRQKYMNINVYMRSECMS